MYFLFRNNNRDGIVGVFIRERVWLENSLRYWELGDGKGTGQSRETGCGGQPQPSGARVSM